MMNNKNGSSSRQFVLLMAILGCLLFLLGVQAALAQQQSNGGVCSADEDCGQGERCTAKYLQDPGAYPSKNMNRYNFFHTFYPVLRFVANCYFMLVNALFTLYNGFQPITHVDWSNTTSPLLFMSARKAAAQIRAGNLTSSELVKAYVERIKEANPLINAIVYDNFDAALKQAADADAQLANMTAAQRAQLAQTKPFFGVPFTSKNNLEAIGFVISACNQAYIDANKTSTTDAPVVKRMKDAGAILIAITILPNLGLSTYCDDSACGIANNPHDTRRTTGGSSSGEGAIISSAGSVVGLGNDLGGSLRVPSHYCGVYGLKATSYPNHTVPIEGAIPSTLTSFKPAADMFSNGPICRYADDLPIVLSVLANQPLDKYDIQVDFGKNFRLFYVEDLELLLSESLHPELRDSVRKVKNYFEQKYALTVPRINFPLMNRLFELLDLTGYSEGVTPLYPNLTNQFWELYNSKPGQVGTTFLYWELEGVLKNFVYPKDDIEKAFVTEKKAKLHRQLSTLLGKDGVLVMPVAPAPVPFHHMEPFKPFNLAYTMLYNMLGLPVLTVPTGKSPETNMPLGVQIVAAPFNEALLIATGRELEKAFGGWVIPGKLPKALALAAGNL